MLIVLVAQSPHHGLPDAEALSGPGNPDPGVIIDESVARDPVEQSGAFLAQRGVNFDKQKPYPELHQAPLYSIVIAASLRGT